MVSLHGGWKTSRDPSQGWEQVSAVTALLYCDSLGIKKPERSFFALKEPNFSFLPEALPCFYKHLHFSFSKPVCWVGLMGL